MLGKLFLLIALTLGLASPGFAAVAHVQSTFPTAAGPVASLSKAFTSNITAGNTIVVGGICFGSGSCDAADNVWSDSRSQTYNTQKAQGGRATVAFSSNAAAGATTVTLTPQVPDFIGFGISEFSGVNASPIDATAGTNTTGANATVNITSTTDGLIYGALNLEDSGGTITVGSGYNQVWEDESFSAVAGGVEYKIATAGTQAVNWTSPNQGSTGYYIAAMALKEAVSTAPIVRIINY